MQDTISDNKLKQRYELVIGEHIVYADYRHDDGVLSILYVEAPSALRGTGAAGRLMQGIMEKAKAENLKVKPICGYAASWIERNKDYHGQRA